MHIVLQRTLEERLKEVTTIRGVLDIRICDPSCGTGNFSTASHRDPMRKNISIKERYQRQNLSKQDIVMNVVESCIYGIGFTSSIGSIVQNVFVDESTKASQGNVFFTSHLKGQYQVCNSLLGVSKEQISDGIKINILIWLRS